MSQMAALRAGLGFACVPLARSGLRLELEVWIHHLSGWLWGKWPSMFFVLHFVFATASVAEPGASSPGVLCRSWPPLQMLLTLSESSQTAAVTCRV